MARAQATRETTVLTVVDEVAALRTGDPCELPPIQNTLDADGLDALLASPFSGTVTFEYAGCEVVVHGDGGVDVRERQTADS